MFTPTSTKTHYVANTVMNKCQNPSRMTGQQGTENMRVRYYRKITSNSIHLQVRIWYIFDWYISVSLLKKGMIFWTEFCFILSSIEQYFEGIWLGNMMDQSVPRYTVLYIGFRLIIQIQPFLLH